MIDVFSRPLRQYDLILAKEGSNFLSVGLYIGKSCTRLNWKNEIEKSAPQYCYLLENPTDREEEIRNKILTKLGLKMEEK